ncbi:DUF1499 domain-containing protein [Rhodoferax sp. GW822-FHT02A01]|uniref:DUF1499 domain-containing protein n=1 Tax=Rhodoferax sp. GW822-FHT02A01 TaxID=3141537 RepID=UPI00315D2228
MKVLGFGILFILLMAAAVVLVGQLGLLKGRMPADLGVREGRLKPPSSTPNSVSSQADLYPNHPQRDYARIAPLGYAGDGDAAMARLATLLKGMDRTTVVTQQADYLYVQCTTAVLKFTDDVEFWLDRSAHVIQVRSASRLGASDLGVNRKRVEKIRAQFQKN